MVCCKSVANLKENHNRFRSSTVKSPFVWKFNFRRRRLEVTYRLGRDGCFVTLVGTYSALKALII